MDRDVRVFIGGSSEGLKYAKKLSLIMNQHNSIICDVWNDTFEYNESFLDSLRKSSLIYDCGIFIATKDDYAKIRGEFEEVPRDNIVFEYGLFLGEMKNSRTFLLQEEGCKLPTDVLGYTTPRFNINYTESQWSDLVNNIVKNIIKQSKNSIIQSLPSTSLAIGYYNSFLKKLSKLLMEAEGSVLNKSQLGHGDVFVEVLIPTELSNDIGEMAFAYCKKNKYIKDEIGCVNRPFPIRYFLKEDTKELRIIDIPTTLNSIRPSIGLLVPKSNIGKHEDIMYLERKELENFKKTLEFLVNSDDYSKEIINIRWM